MNTKTLARTAAFAVIAVVLAVAAAACTSKGDAKSPPISFTANPTVSAELNQAEQALLGNIQEHFSALHPVKSVEAGIAATYPNGSTTKIVNFAVKNFTLAVVHPLHGANPARDAWLLKVTNYAQSLGASPGATASPSPVASVTASGTPA